MLRTVAQGIKVCLTVTHVDGLVIARSGFHHSINYRAVMAFGTAEKVEDDAHKLAALEAFVERLFPGRWATLRPVTPQELKATTVLSMPLDEVSAKVRVGPPKDDEEDYALPIWAGVLPLTLTPGVVEADPLNLAGLALPEHVRDFALER
jgi:nitroimidazol reductase NimA-like FMN-containing flavoprotein (pyridoxamine 5'-phosphate oxidase superfamily)